MKKLFLTLILTLSFSLSVLTADNPLYNPANYEEISWEEITSPYTILDEGDDYVIVVTDKGVFVVYN